MYASFPLHRDVETTRVNAVDHLSQQETTLMSATPSDLMY